MKVQELQEYMTFLIRQGYADVEVGIGMESYTTLNPIARIIVPTLDAGAAILLNYDCKPLIAVKKEDENEAV